MSFARRTAALAFVLTLACGATTELATAETALQFPAHDPAALAACVERLLNDGALRQRIAKTGLAVAMSRTWDSIFDRLVLDYREALSVGRPSRTANV